jgi:hypothetical protein
MIYARTAIGSTGESVSSIKWTPPFGDSSACRAAGCALRARNPASKLLLNYRPNSPLILHAAHRGTGTSGDHLKGVVASYEGPSSRSNERDIDASTPAVATPMLPSALMANDTSTVVRRNPATVDLLTPVRS